MTDSQEKEVPNLPEETVEYILSCLDGRTLGFAEQVCVNWNRLCKRQKAKSWWKSCCEKEIPKSALCDILNKKYPTHFVQGSKDCVDWKYVYKRWCQWSQIHNYSVLHHITPVNAFKNWLNIMKTSGYWIFLTSDHLVFAYHMESTYHHVMFKTNCHIIDIDLKVDVKCNTTTSCNPEWLPDSAKMVNSHEFEHKYLIVNMVESQSVEIDLQTKEEKRQRYIQRSWAGKTVRVHSASRSTSISVVDEMTSKVITEFSEILYDDYDILDFCNTMVLLKNHQNPYDVYAVDINRQSVERLEESMTLNINYSWCCSVLVGFKTAWQQSDIWLLMNGKKIVFNPFIEIETNVTSVLFYNNNLILGTDSGYVYIYEVTGTNGLLSLDLRSHKMKHKCSNEAITCIEVMDKADDPCLLLFTGQLLMILKFIQI